MATLLDLYNYAVTPSAEELRKRIAVACTIKAKAIGDLGTPTQAQIDWARSCLTDPVGVAGVVYNYVLAANAAVTIAQIEGATDAQVQTAVDAAVDTILSL